MKPDVGSPVEVTVGPPRERGCFVIQLGTEAVWRFAGAPTVTTEPEQRMVIHVHPLDAACALEGDG